ncbi:MULTISPECIES: class I SAM-dependent RNA methyltransferase [unclassified Nocardia]|uniref:class I SAM-dependent RNA methyltransferase n=1 Tax=unclassified Nocardia TaxID=2637762 RepID=UPI00278C816E|nr:MULTISPECIES: TRAM domain-containing protein [unclassified Nocardia]
MGDWRGAELEVRLGPPGHGGFCVARHEGRVLFVRHGLPGELVRARVTEDRGGSFCRAEAFEILEPSPDRVPALCPVSGVGGAGCCDFSYATPEAQRGLKAMVVTEQLRRLAGWETEIVVEPIPVDLGLLRRTATSNPLGPNSVPTPDDDALTGGGRSGGTAPGESVSGDSGTAAGRRPGGRAPGNTEPIRGWRSRVRLAVDSEGRAGVHRYRGAEVIPDLRCPQPVAGAMAGIAERIWTPGADLVVAVDGDGQRHIVELGPPDSGAAGSRRAEHADRRTGYGPPGGRGGADRGVRGGSRGRHGDVGGRHGGAVGDRRNRPDGRGRSGSENGRGGPYSDRRGRSNDDRRGATARRAAAHAPRTETVVEGTGRAVQYVAGRRWELSATGFWQPHIGAAQCYSDVVAEWAYASPGALAWDLYCGVGVFAARVAEQVGATGAVSGVELARTAVADGTAALGDLPWVRLRAERVERWIAEQPSATPEVVVLDPPRAGAGKEVVAALAARSPRRIVHIGCDPAAFARDIGLYRDAGYLVTELRAFDAFPGTHHVECLALLEL